MVHHHDALAQMLDDVLRELGQVGEIDLLAPHRGLGVAQSARHRPGQQRHQEDDAGRGFRCPCSRPTEASPSTCAPICWNSSARVASAASRKASRLSASSAMAPTGTTNRMPSPLAVPPLEIHQQADRRGIDRGMNEGGCAQIGQQAPAADDDGDPGGEIHQAGPQEQFLVRVSDRGLGAEDQVQRVDRRRNQQPIQIDQADDTPGEIGRGGRSCAERHRPRLYQQAGVRTSCGARRNWRPLHDSGRIPALFCHPRTMGKA